MSWSTLMSNPNYYIALSFTQLHDKEHLLCFISQSLFTLMQPRQVTSSPGESRHINIMLSRNHHIIMFISCNQNPENQGGHVLKTLGSRGHCASMQNAVVVMFMTVHHRITCGGRMIVTFIGQGAMDHG
jgi:hypothetical protein